MIIKKAESKATNLLEQLNIQELPIPISKIAEECGVKIKPYDFGEDISGVLVINKKKCTIGFNPFESEVRQRFTIAHELGHFFMHANQSKEELFVDTGFKVHFRDQNSSTGENKKEQEANAFAAAILMPAKLLLSKIKELDIDLTDELAIKKLAQMFNVSPIAMTIRISNLRMAFH